jgi:Ran GTPase-activating protein (RanGAP) involved in mRNA processing and transport
MVNLGRLLRNKYVNIEKIDLSGIKLNLNDIKYFISFDLNKLQILDLSSNSIGIQGALNFSKGQFSCLESLNLNYNYISDKGLDFICNGFFSKLNYLYLNKNNISFEGIKHLVKAEFTNNLIILSLDENKKIGDSGIRIIKEHKCWSKLNILYLNKTGLTDIALRYIGESSMPKLRKLNIAGNKFTDDGKPSINGLRMNHIRVNYKNIITIENNKEDDQYELGYYFIDGTHKQFE